MKVNLLNREETFRIRHFSLDLTVEEQGQLYPFNITLIEDFDVRAKSYHYEVECLSCKQMPAKKDVAAIEMKLEGYLIDNALDLLTRKLPAKKEP